MRADLHVHSLHSGARHYRRAGMRDCYAHPSEVYDAAKKAGMDLVTLTDVDTIDGCLRILDERGGPSDFMTGEEVEARVPDSPLRVHVSVWGITERQHAEIQRAKADVTGLAAYLRAEGIAACFNHFLGSLPVDLPAAALYWRVLSLFDALEVRNGGQGRSYNALVAALAEGEAARRRPVAFIGGSDAHTPRRVGATWTETRSSTREEFLQEIRRGRSAAGGRVRGAADGVLDLGGLMLSHYRSLWLSLTGAPLPGEPPAGLLRSIALLPLLAVGAPLIGTAIYFARVRGQVKALQREIAALDLAEFRERMGSFPRVDDEPPADRKGLEAWR